MSFDKKRGVNKLEKKQVNILIGVGIVVALLLLGIFALLCKAFMPYYKYPVHTDIVNIAHETERKANPNMWEWEEETTKEGRKCRKEVYTYYKDKYINGEFKGREQIFPLGRPTEKIIEEPVTRIVEYGTNTGHATGYKWLLSFETKDYLAHPTYFSLTVTIKDLKCNPDDGTLLLVLEVENLPSSYKFISHPIKHFFRVADENGKQIEDLAEARGPESLEPGKTGEITLKFKGVKEFQLEKCKLLGATMWPFWGDHNFVPFSEPLDKFWVKN